MAEWKISNAVFTLRFDTVFNLNKIAQKLLDYNSIFINYEPEEFPGLIIKIKNHKEKYSIVMFRSGIINISGIRNDINKIYSIIELLKKLLKECRVELPNSYEIRLGNVVISGKFDYTNIDIEKIYRDFDDAYYDPNQFPAVTVYYYVSDEYKVSFNIFKDGKFICAGIKGDLNSIHQHINEIVNSFQENIIKKYAK
ncbi:MAG: hypothetical protein ACO2ON_01005 [Candidatus Nanopusillus sp.]